MDRKKIWLRWAMTGSLLFCVMGYQYVHIGQLEAGMLTAEAKTAEAKQSEAKPSEQSGQPEQLGQTGQSDQPAQETTMVAEGPFTDGVYTGSGKGYGGIITVDVIVEHGLISDISVTSAEGEDKPYLRDAKQIINEVIAAQHTRLDAISGATSTTWGILDAVDDAMKEFADE